MQNISQKQFDNLVRRLLSSDFEIKQDITKSDYLKLALSGEICSREGSPLDFSQVMEHLIPKLENNMRQEIAPEYFLFLLNVINISTEEIGIPLRISVESMSALIYEYDTMPETIVSNNLLSCLSFNKYRVDVGNLIKSICHNKFKLTREDIYLLLTHWPNQLRSIATNGCLVHDIINLVVSCEELALEDPGCNLDRYYKESGVFIEHLIHRTPVRTVNKYLSSIASILLRSKSTFTNLPRYVTDKMSEIIEI